MGVSQLLGAHALDAYARQTYLSKQMYGENRWQRECITEIPGRTGGGKGAQFPPQILCIFYQNEIFLIIMIVIACLRMNGYNFIAFLLLSIQTILVKTT